MITEQQALDLIEKKWWIGKTYREIAEFQMFGKRLCCPFQIFHEALEKTLERPVFTHEMGMNWDGLCQELLGNKPKPTFEDILNLISIEKLIVVKI